MSDQKCTEKICVNTLKIFGDFWNLRIINALEKNGLRYCEIERSLGDTNPVTLANRLQKLEQANIINKKQDIDFGIAATYNGTHFTADPRGVLQLDSVISGNFSWDDSMTTCFSAGKRLPSISSFKALHGISSAIFPIETTYWSSTESPTNSASAFRIYTTDGTFTTFEKTGIRRVWCGS